MPEDRRWPWPNPAGQAYAFARWTEIVGPDYVDRSEETRAAYAMSTSGHATTPAAVLRPASAEEVAEIVRVAGEAGVAVYPISGGHNWGYSDSSAPEEGNVIIDLRRMTGIEINPNLAYAVIEPGVTQGQLAKALKDQGAALWTDCTGAGPDTSIVGNVLDGGFGHSIYGHRWQAVSGLEVVLPDGRLLRTGFGHYRGAKTTHVFSQGLGPVVDGLFRQSGMGIVTRMGIWLIPEAEACELVFCTVAEPTDIGPFVDRVRDLRLSGVIRSVAHIGNDLRVIASGRSYPREGGDGRAALRPDIRSRLRDQAGIGAWTMSAAVYGPKAQVRAAKGIIRRVLRGPGRRIRFINDRKLRIGETLCALGRSMPWAGPLKAKLEAARALLELNRGTPSARFLAGSYWRHRDGIPKDMEAANPARDGCGFYWLSPVLPLDGAAVRDLLARIEPVFERYGFDLFITMSTINERALGAVLTIAFDRESPEETERAKSCYDALFDLIVDAGYPPYRVALRSMDHLAEGSDVFWDFVHELKATVDPGGVISPGRYDPRRAASGGRSEPESVRPLDGPEAAPTKQSL